MKWVVSLNTVFQFTTLLVVSRVYFISGVFRFSDPAPQFLTASFSNPQFSYNFYLDLVSFLNFSFFKNRQHFLIFPLEQHKHVILIGSIYEIIIFVLIIHVLIIDHIGCLS